MKNPYTRFIVALVIILVLLVAYLLLRFES